jgi:hypothetical protein
MMPAATTGSTLDTVPRIFRGTASNAEPTQPPTRLTARPVAGDSAAFLAFIRASSGDYFAWLGHVRAAAGCTRPVRLAVHPTDPATGRRLPVDLTAVPDGVIYKACGNRRAAVCPACAEVYRRDAFQLIRAGLVGGKGVPDTVTGHDAVFATFTAPSFGTVHTRVVKRHTCGSRRRCDCRAEPCHARRHPTGLCEHGQAAVCWVRHEEADPKLGRPLCLDCYDHDHQVVWNHWAGELWRRTKQAIERHLAQLAWRRGISPVLITTASGNLREVPPVRVSHGKAAEFQTRGAVHFHALIRLDGVDPTDPNAIVAPPAAITGHDLQAAIEHAAATVTFHTPDHPDRPGGWSTGWGEQVDIKHITLTADGEVTDTMAAGYLAKYATKSTEATGHRSARLDAETVDGYADPAGDHTARLLDACWRLGRATHTPVPLADRPRPTRPATRLRSPWACPGCGGTTRLAECPHCAAPTGPAAVDTYVSTSTMDNPYAGLRRWAHMLGFGGHFLTKARRYSVTFALLREARVLFRRSDADNDGHGHDEDQDAAVRAADHPDQSTRLIVGTLTFAGAGWHTPGDALLANTAAALARERRQAGRDELHHEIGTALHRTTTAAA